ncbi:protein-L-isoaspartate O-methyltransferase [Pandoraea terrae]|uniref:Protein-L-isoaspartate O-methyltransferase n=1 Tax=Pandoraea terrae TaxID=1537710 RepID=A0A5E4UEU0_9BURK|nr:protein-L-isoaspartate(D-aspartate) O-methyltransferase [Pandoraea terrae]VVD98576.1 protein-L-isoaspartate O-methyltransferase [Pandoraea terrae]
MTTPPKRFPLPLADVMARRQRKSTALDKAARVSPAGAPPASMTRPATPASGKPATPPAAKTASKPGTNMTRQTTSHAATKAASGAASAAAAGKPAHALRASATSLSGASARPQPGGGRHHGGTHAAGAKTGAARPAAAPHAQPVPKPAAKPAAKSVSPGGGMQKTVARAATQSDGVGLTSERVRLRLAERVEAFGVKHRGVLDAIATVPRHGFVDAALANQAYEDAALPIGHGQTISKPSVVGWMIELMLAGRPTLDKVLEIGTGCGYQAAVLSLLAREVYSIERIRPLHERAKANLRPLRVPNIRLHYGDGRLGLPSVAPFDGIIIAAAGLEVPQALLEQLAVGARLVAPVGGEQQYLTLIERTGPRQWRETRLDRVLFVPLKSGII